jgi:hypothetical protein
LPVVQHAGERAALIGQPVEQDALFPDGPV